MEKTKNGVDLANQSDWASVFRGLPEIVEHFRKIDKSFLAPTHRGVQSPNPRVIAYSPGDGYICLIDR